ncbi:MAG: SDR family NAD(P)-dependent oxidoreductase [Mycobacterium sp.]|uniref:SDR family NAD(P)-dependent oxidoreductase n=1 Tax=Mycobacterium sp. TaxID=1785 RepID=UPI003F9545FB
MRRLDGKVILVAGAGGIGNELARRYAAEGARVVLGDINLASAEDVVSEIEKAGGEAIAIHLDGSDEQSADGAVTTCVKTYGGLDGLHANFACMEDSNPELGILELPLEIFDKTQQLEAELPPKFLEWAQAAASIKSRVGRPADIAAMGALLMSDEGAYITGQVLCIDGGTTMRA